MNCERGLKSEIKYCKLENWETPETVQVSGMNINMYKIETYTLLTFQNYIDNFTVLIVRK